MEYLFFDLEFADGKDKICEFGYVITDENFEILERYNFIINPNISNDDWDLMVLNEILTKPKMVYETSYNFFDCYPDISDIFNEVDMVFGHTTYSDVNGLNEELKRYGLEPINFKFYDIHEIYKSHYDSTKNTSLSEMVEKFNIYCSDKFHDAEIDSVNTMNVLKHMCSDKLLTVEQIINASPNSVDETVDFNIKSTERRNEQQEKEFLKFINGDETNTILPSSINKRKFLQFIDNAKPNKPGSNMFNGLRFAASIDYEINHYNQMLNIVQMIINEGGTYTQDLLHVDVFIKIDSFDDEGNIIQCSRYNYLTRDLTNIMVISLEDFLNKFNLNTNQLDNMDRPSFDFLFDDNIYIKSSLEKETIERIKLKRKQLVNG